jgi:hypothetical protein
MSGYIISDKYEINVEEHEIISFDILDKTKKNMFAIENNKVSYKNKYKNIFVIENNKVSYKNFIINNACQNGHIQVLEWFKNSGFKFEYDKWAFIWASKHGHDQVLEWFKNSGYKFKHDKYAIIMASQNGHIQVLEWFKNSRFEFKYHKIALKTKFSKILKFFSYNINIEKLIKWSNNKIFIKTIKFKTNNKYLKGYKKN